MDLLAQVGAVTSRANRELDAVYDFYEHSLAVWHTFKLWVGAGNPLQVSNVLTGTVVDEKGLLALSPRYQTAYLLNLTFQHYVALFETFFFDFLKVLLLKNPYPFAAKPIDLRELLQAPDKDAAVSAVLDRGLNELKYDSVAEWFVFLPKVMQLGCPADDEVARLAEVKASRDVLVHNAGVANAVYVRKSKGKARYKEGDALEVPPDYHREAWALLKKVVTDLADAARLKLSNP